MTIAPVSNIPVSIDYTGRDYYSIREQLIARIQERIPEWTASDPSDFGIALVEAFSYMGDLLSYYIDRTANEFSIATATQRNSILNIAQTYGYVPAGYRNAITSLTFTNSSTAVTLPAGTVVSGELITADVVKPVYFTTLSDAVIGASSSYTVVAEEGRYINVVSSTSDATYGQSLGSSSQTPGMRFELLNTPVVDGSISLYVQDGDVYSKWTQVQHLVDYGPTDLVYTVSSDENNVISVNFGDGVSGAIPVLSSEFRAMYTVGGGTLGNVSAGILTNLSYVPNLSTTQLTAIKSVITVTNATAAYGGSDPESNNQIRIAAPATLRAANRAVTLRDYEDLALSVSGVGKSNAYASTWTSVTVYISPSRNLNDTDIHPGLDDSNAVTAEQTSLSSDVLSYLSDKILIGSSVTIQPPVYSDLVITIQYTKLDQYTQAETETNIKKALLTAYGYVGMNFQDTIYPQDIEYVLNQTNGVKIAKLTALYKTGSTITGNATNVKVGYNLDTVASGYITYTVNQRHAFKAGGTVTISGLSAAGFNVTSAAIVAVDDTRIVVANATTGTASGTGVVTGLSGLNGYANEIFRFQESNTNLVVG